jgi:hypothetical protein
MPTVQYVNQFRKQNITKEMLTPKRITELRYWLKGAQAVIKEIPRMIAESEQSADRSIGTDGWFVATSDADVKWVKFSLENRLGEKAHIVIHRQSKLLG